MTKNTLSGSAILIAIGLFACTKPSDTPKGSPNENREVYTNAMDAINAQNDEIIGLSRVIYELAAERFAANTNGNQKWVLTSHPGRMIRRYTDRKYTVVSLPIVEPRDEIAIRRYCTHYNAFSERAADLKVEAGHYSEARELFQLLHHFDRGDRKDDYGRKLKLLDKLEKKEDAELNLKQFMELSRDLVLGIDFSQIDKVNPTVVTNLLDVRLP